MPSKDLGYYMTLRYPLELREGEAGGYFATHPDLDGCMAEGATADEAIANLGDSRELWIEAQIEGGYPVPEPRTDEPSGYVSLRMAPSLHGRLAEMATRQDISLNLLMNTVLSQYAGGVDALWQVVESARQAEARGAAPGPEAPRGTAAAAAPRRAR
jgi:antitoxin HicB